MLEGVCPDPGLLPPGGEHLDVSGGCSPPRLPDLRVLEVEGPPGGLARTLIGDLDELLVQGEVVPYRVLNTAIIINYQCAPPGTEYGGHSTVAIQGRVHLRIISYQYSVHNIASFSQLKLRKSLHSN